MTQARAQRPVIVGVDGSDVTLAAARFAFDEARRRPAPLITEVRDGDPVAVLHELSARAQLIVLGSRGLGGVAGLLLGSTASGVVAHAQCPVVVLPDDTSVVVRDPRSVVVPVSAGENR